eukprot:815867-Pyramimonas_sp.AAC.1
MHYGYWQFVFRFRAPFGFGQFCEDHHLCFGRRARVSGGVYRMLFQHGVYFYRCFFDSALDADAIGGRCGGARVGLGRRKSRPLRRLGSHVGGGGGR